MKKTLLCLMLVAFGTYNASAQSCTPGVNFQDSTFGVWPDTTQNLPWATANVAYSTDINFKVPSVVTIDIDPSGQFVGSTIQSFTVTGLVGLPAGYNFACNNATCTYNGGVNGCANVYGISGTTGTYPVTIEVDATVLIVLFPGLPPTPVTQAASFSGYKIIIGTAGLVEGIINPLTISPNPSNGVISINGITTSMNASTVVISNLAGKVISQKELNGSTACSFDLIGMNAGIYFASVNYNGGVETIKFIVD